MIRSNNVLLVKSISSKSLRDMHRLILQDRITFQRFHQTVYKIIIERQNFKFATRSPSSQFKKLLIISFT